MKTKTRQQMIMFKASPRDLYEMIMDSRKHSLLSSERAKSSRKVGGSFTTWSGHISGINLVLTPGKKSMAGKEGSALSPETVDIEQVKAIGGPCVSWSCTRSAILLRFARR